MEGPPPGEALKRAASMLDENGSTGEDPVLAGIEREKQAKYRGVATPRFPDFIQSADVLSQELGLNFTGTSIPSINHPDRNEDHIALIPDQSLAMVFDGVGGLAAGDRASSLAREVVAGRLGSIPSSEDAESVKKEMGDALVEASNRILKEVPKSGTTAVVAKFIEKKGQRQVIIGSVGDSRAYILREGILLQVTEDDSAVSASGLSSEEQKRTNQKLDHISNEGNLANLTDKEKYYWENRNAIDQMLGDEVKSPIPHIYQTTLEEGDKVILTSDGVHDNLTVTEIEQVLNSGSTDLASVLTEKAKMRSAVGSVRSKPDDISAVVIDVEPRSGVIEPQLPQAREEEEQSEEPKRAWFQNVLSGVREGLPHSIKERFNGEAVKKVAGQAWEKASNVRVLGQPLVDMAVGTGLGFGVRTAARAGLFAAGAGGVAPLLAGAVGGAGVEAFKRVRVEQRGYKEFTQKLTDEFENLVSGEFGIENVATLVKRYQELEAQTGQETNKRIQEALYDQMRYLGVYIKRSEKGKEKDGKALLDAFFKSEGTTITRDQTEAELLFKAIKETKLVDRGKLAWAVGRGAVFGAAGGIVGGACGWLDCP